MAKPLGSPLIYTYLKKYQEDPTSRIFAPLAEAYRKAGLIDEAIEIASEGLKLHPSFIGGKVALARAYFDKKQYEEVIGVLAPVVIEVPDNLVAQRLIGESSLMIGRYTEALTAFKMLLYFNPQDVEIAKIVKELEVQAYEQGNLILRKDPEPHEGFQIKSANQIFHDDPQETKRQWITKIQLLQELLKRIERYRLTRAR